MAELHREKDYTVRFAEARSKLSRKSLDGMGDYYEDDNLKRKLDIAHSGYDYRYGDKRGKMPTNNVKFCVSTHCTYKLHDGYSVRYKHKDHDKRVDGVREESERQRALYDDRYLNAHLDEYEMIVEPYINSSYTDRFKNPIEIKL